MGIGKEPAAFDQEQHSGGTSGTADEVRVWGGWNECMEFSGQCKRVWCGDNAAARRIWCERMGEERLRVTNGQVLSMTDDGSLVTLAHACHDFSLQLSLAKHQYEHDN